MQPVVQLKPLHHRGQECIALIFNYQKEIQDIVKRLAGVKWSRSNRCWYVPLADDLPEHLSLVFKDRAKLVMAELTDHLEKKIAVTTTVPVLRQKDPSALVVGSPAWKLSNGNIAALKRFIEQLQLKAYSAATIRTYRNEFLQLLQLLGEKHVNELTQDDLRRYMLYAMYKQGIKENTAHSRLNALKFYFEQVLGREQFFWEIPRPKKKNELPKIFSQDEVAAIINHTHNKKHKAMLMLAYSAGLRISEVVSLRTVDVDSKRMTILIRQAKGKKDRLASLSPVLLIMLREYAKEYKPDKRGFLFEGVNKGTCYSTRSLQEVMQAAKKKAGILKPGSIHGLRHSFATHLVDRGTDISMIQKLLGHNSIKTTLRYLHTSNKDLLKIVSPLDDLKLTP